VGRRSILKVVKVSYTPSAPWMVRVPKRLPPRISREGVRRATRAAAWRLSRAGPRLVRPSKARSFRVLSVARWTERELA
jgi:hypothetical protein